MVVLACYQTSQVKHNTASLITLPQDRDIRMLESSKFFPVPLAFALELFGNLLLENKCLEGIISLLLSPGETDGQASIVILLLINETAKTSVLTLVCLNLDLEVLCFFREGLSEGLKFEELWAMLEISIQTCPAKAVASGLPVASSSPTPRRGSCSSW